MPLLRLQSACAGLVRSRARTTTTVIARFRAGYIQHVSPRGFASSARLHAAPLPPRRVLLDSEIIENFLKGSGPGGQKINKTSSAVQLKHIPTGIVVKCQDTRSRTQNRKTARKTLQDKIEEMELGEDARTKVKGRAISKKKKSAEKKKRRKYRALGEKEEDGEEGAEGEGEESEGAYEQDESAFDKIERPTEQKENKAQDGGRSVR